MSTMKEWSLKWSKMASLKSLDLNKIPAWSRFVNAVYQKYRILIMFVISGIYGIFSNSEMKAMGRICRTFTSLDVKNK